MSVDFRVGSGFDVHSFGAVGGELILCGVKIKHGCGLAGHSDADVALHALTDAILGAIGAGDIGLHFPPSDDKWKGVDSSIFVRHVVELAKAKGGIINNVDITIICEQPKLTSYNANMQQSVADIIDIAVDRVNIKATTTEKLGFLGRNEGIAAQGVVTVKYE